MAIIGSLKYENLYALNFLNVQEKPQNILLIKGKLGRIRDIEIHPNNGKIYLINSDKFMDDLRNKQL